MSLFKRMFGDKAGAPPSSLPAPSTGFEDSDADALDDEPSRGPGRREVVHMVLRETMRQHGIPSDWLEGRVLKLAEPSRGPAGTYVTLVVRGGQERLLSYAPAFQASLREALARFDPRASEWLRGISWEFADGPSPSAKAGAHGAKGASRSADKGAAAAATKPASDTIEPTPSMLQPLASPAEADELEQDLQALFAIRDAALREPQAPVTPAPAAPPRRR